jgi:hypothetical protein
VHRNNGHHRKELRKIALSEAIAGRTSELHVKDVSSRFHRWSQFDKAQPRGVRKLLRAPNSSAMITSGPMPPTKACEFQYSINVPGFGYSSRLRSLLRSGNVVLHVVSTHACARHSCARFATCRCARAVLAQAVQDLMHVATYVRAYLGARVGVPAGACVV